MEVKQLKQSNTESARQKLNLIVSLNIILFIIYFDHGHITDCITNILSCIMLKNTWQSKTFGNHSLDLSTIYKTAAHMVSIRFSSDLVIRTPFFSPTRADTFDTRIFTKQCYIYRFSEIFTVKTVWSRPSPFASPQEAKKNPSKKARLYPKRSALF